MNARLRLTFLLSLAVLMGCRTKMAPPVPGELTVELSSSAPAARAILFTLVGQQSDIHALSGSPYRIFSAAGGADTTQVLVVSTSSQGLSKTALASVTVADTRRWRRYSATTVEVAGGDYTLRNSADYTLAVVRQ